jgi:hypothetical protein
MWMDDQLVWTSTPLKDMEVVIINGADVDGESRSDGVEVAISASREGGYSVMESKKMRPENAIIGKFESPSTTPVSGCSHAWAFCPVSFDISHWTTNGINHIDAYGALIESVGKDRWFSVNNTDNKHGVYFIN